jgi:dihydrofolate synthase/folylpolyglutamate synthase
MPNNAYQSTITWLFEQFPSYQNIGYPAYKPDLGNIRELCSFLDHPEKNLRFIHVAGTNGKGSVSSMLASILTESGQKTGLFTSPHLIDFRERIRVNGEMISESDVVSFCDLIRSYKWDDTPSFFEITFGMALWHFYKQGTTICVIETGLGGRLDATNIIQPIISVITNISLEHTQFLGNTLTEIAREKAGIIKMNTPVVIGESTTETAPVFNQIANERFAPLIDCTNSHTNIQYKPPLLGNYQHTNLRTVLQTLRVLNSIGMVINDTQIEAGLLHLQKNTGFMGRMQVVSKDPVIILDVSHNEDGILKTLESLANMNQGELHIIYGSSSDKDYKKIVSLFPKNAQLNFCTFKNQRSLTLGQFEQLNRDLSANHSIYTDVNQALTMVNSVAKKQDTILIFGSFFLAADFF